MNKPANILLIGGSAGSFQLLMNLIPELPDQFSIPVVVIIHRLKNVVSEMDQLFSKASKNKVILEPEDKAPIEGGKIYLAPQNYHLLIEPEGLFSLDYSEQINFSRPSIDLSFSSAAIAFKAGCLGVLLSGANKDGANGVRSILQYGGKAIIQDPSDATYPVMPEAAIMANPDALIATSKEITQIIQTTLEQSEYGINNII